MQITFACFILLCSTNIKHLSHTLWFGKKRKTIFTRWGVLMFTIKVTPGVTTTFVHFWQNSAMLGINMSTDQSNIDAIPFLDERSTKGWKCVRRIGRVRMRLSRTSYISWTIDFGCTAAIQGWRWTLVLRKSMLALATALEIGRCFAKTYTSITTGRKLMSMKVESVFDNAVALESLSPMTISSVSRVNLRLVI